VPQIKSQMKRMRISEKQRLRNRGVKSALKTYISAFEKAFDTGDKKLCENALGVAVKSLDIAVSKGVIHKNKAANKKSKLTVKFNAMPEKAPEPEVAPAKEKKATKRTGAKKKTAAKKSTAKKTTAKAAASTAKKTTKATTKDKPKATRKKATTKKSTKKEK